MAVATRADCDEMAGAIGYFLWGQGAAAFADSLPPGDLDLLVHTEIAVEQTASRADMAATGTPAGFTLLGIYTYPPPLIRVFADGVLGTHHDPVDVVSHELGHRFGFDHSRFPVSTGLMVGADGGVHCSSFHPEAAQPTGWLAEPEVAAHDDQSCPFCRLHSRTAEVEKLADGLRRRAWLAAQPTLIPLGLGGTIPLMRRKLTEAHEALLACADTFPDRRGEVRDVDRLLHVTEERLAGHLTTEQVTPVWEAAYAAWNASYSLTHSYFLHTRHPGEVLRDLP